MKTLHTIQTLSKIGKVLSKIVYICCIIGFCGCAAGVAAMLLGAETIKLGGVTLHSILEAEAGLCEGAIWSAVAAGAILCTGEFFVARTAHCYFANELAAGTPFTLDGAKELFRLGIITICVPLGSLILAEIVSGILAGFLNCDDALKIENGGSVALGVMFIVMSLLCQYGAEGRENGESGKNELP